MGRHEHPLTAHVLSPWQLTAASGQFELQVVKVQNSDSELRSGQCCGGAPRPSEEESCPRQCRTAVALCLKEWSVAAAEQQAGQEGGPVPVGCTYGYNSSKVLGPSSFTLAQSPPNGHLHLRFTFSWTVSTGSRLWWIGFYLLPVS